MSADEKVARCCACRSEFTDTELAGHSACPSCGNKGVPMDPRKDATISINPHELRILTIWASNWSEKCDDSARRSLNGILGALSKQLPGVALTLGVELQDLANELGSKVELHQGGDVKTFKGTKPS